MAKSEIEGEDSAARALARLRENLAKRGAEQRIVTDEFGELREGALASVRPARKGKAKKPECKH